MCVVFALDVFCVRVFVSSAHLNISGVLLWVLHGHDCATF